MAAEGPEHPIWPDDGSLSAENEAHIVAALWALYTVNPNALSGVRKYMETIAADVPIAQEANTREEATDQADQSAKLSKWNCMIK